MKVLDRYVLGLFLRAFVGTLVLFTVSIVVLDFFSRMGRFAAAVEKTEALFDGEMGRTSVVLRFYAAYVPFILKEVLAFVTVAAGIFTLSTLLRNNEVMPALAAGVSGRRLLLPLLLFGFAVALAHIAFQEWVVPSLGREQLALRRLFEGQRPDRLHRIPHLRDGRGTVVRAGGYSLTDGSLRDVVVQRPWGERGFETVVAGVLAAKGEAWEAAEGGRVEAAEPGIAPVLLPPGSRIDIGVSPDEVDVLVSRQGTQEISTRALQGLSARFPQRRSIRVAMHKQLARPFSSLVLLLLGLSILLEAGRKQFLGGVVAFALCTSYYLLDIFCTSLGDRGDLAPVIAAYGPLAIFGSFGFARLLSLST